MTNKTFAMVLKYQRLWEKTNIFTYLEDNRSFKCLKTNSVWVQFMKTDRLTSTGITYPEGRVTQRQ